MNRDDAELKELRNAYQLRVPIDLPLGQESQTDIRKAKKGNRSFADEVSDPEEDDSSSSEVDEEGRPLYNGWKGKNHELHVVGDFQSDFEKKLKGFRKPETIPLSLDPFCRDELPKDDPLIQDAFIVWESKAFQVLKSKGLRSPTEAAAILKKKSNGSLDKTARNDNPSSLQSSALDYSSEDDSGNEDWYGFSDSDQEVEIETFVKVQKRTKREGHNPTGETLWHDDEFDVIRNLHKDSISLTNYGMFPDQKIFGKTAIMFQQLTPEEKMMLTAKQSIPVVKDVRKQPKHIKKQQDKFRLENDLKYGTHGQGDSAIL